jgi:type VI secretion system protein ImpJ
MVEPLTPIHWKEGLFLRPHHLQESSMWTGRVVGYHLQSLSPYNFGVRTLEIDEGRLEEGVFSIRKLELILPNGDVIQVPENTRVAPRNILEPGPGRESKLQVFFGVRRLREQEPNLSLEGLDDPDPGRYMVERRLVYDRNTGRDSQELEFSYYNGRIIFDGEPIEEFDAIPIAELVPPEVGLPLSRLSRQFMPPCVRVRGSEVLVNEIRQLHGSAATKAARLAARADAEGIRSGEAVQGDVLSLWKLHTIQGYVPTLREASEERWMHPYPLFIELCRFAGQLASFSSSQASIEFPKYDHLEPATCFGEIIPVIHRLLDELIPSNYARVPLVQEGFRYTGDLREEWLELRNRWYVCIRSDLEDSLIERWFRGTAKIAAKPRIDDIVSRRLRGVPTAKCDRPRVLPPREGFVYFELQREGVDWNEVRSDRTVCVHLAAEAGMTPEALAALVTEMYVVFGA